MKILRTIINIVLISIIAVCAYKIYDKSAEYKINHMNRLD